MEGELLLAWKCQGGGLAPECRCSSLNLKRYRRWMQGSATRLPARAALMTVGVRVNNLEEAEGCES